MKQLLPVVLLSVSTVLVSGSVTMKGKWQATCGDTVMPERNRFDKTFEDIIGSKVDCIITPPLRWEITVDKDESAPVTERLVTLSWDIPTEREDGSELLLSDIAGYVIYNGQEVYNVEDPSATSYEVVLPLGTYQLSIATATLDGLVGAKSEAIEIVVNQTIKQGD